MKLLLIGDERKNRRMVAWGFAAAPYDVKTANSRAGLEKLLASDGFQAACVDLKMQEDDGVRMVEFLHAKLPTLPIVALAGDKDRRTVPGLGDCGVCAQLTAPFDLGALQAAIRTHALDAPVAVPKPLKAREPLSNPPASGPMLSDEIARRTHELAVRAANSNAAILVLGETGTGKSLLAHTIHQHSAIRSQPFVTVNCPCLNRELLESDLFGHVRGAFTGAVQDTWGKVAAADGGTLFLDEIGDLPMALQPKLLRLLQEKQYERVGETSSRSANVRIIAATNRDLKSEVGAGRFREDLYYRLNVIAIEVPPLGGRPAAVMEAADTFLDAICGDLGKPRPEFSTSARKLLEAYAWPGNLRELRNVVERAAILADGPVLESADFPSVVVQPAVGSLQVGGRISLQALENAHIRLVVANSASLEEAARVLDIDKSTLYRKRKLMEAGVEKFAIEPEPEAVGAL